MREKESLSRKSFVCERHVAGQNLTECVQKFEEAAIFEGLTIYEAEKEIEVLFA